MEDKREYLKEYQGYIIYFCSVCTFKECQKDKCPTMIIDEHLKNSEGYGIGLEIAKDWFKRHEQKIVNH